MGKPITFVVAVTQDIEVTLDADKFDTDFMAEFVESFYNFDTLEEHAEHIAQLQARGLIDLEIAPEFVEGYGPSLEMGIKAKALSTETDIVSRSTNTQGDEG